MIKLYGDPYSQADRVRWALEASGTTYEAEVTRCLTMLKQEIKVNDFLVAKHFTIADLIVSEVFTNLIQSGLTAR